jgi:hypothetical protein
MWFTTPKPPAVFGGNASGGDSSRGNRSSFQGVLGIEECLPHLIPGHPPCILHKERGFGSILKLEFPRSISRLGPGWDVQGIDLDVIEGLVLD